MDLKAFIRQKVKLLDQDTPYSNAACAKLRRAIGKPREDCPDIWEITLPGAPEGDKEGIAIHTCLTLYALHVQGKENSMHSEETRFGAAIAKLVTDHNKNAIMRRFNAMATAQDFSELAHHARGLIQLLKANEIKMDYARFCEDLFYFQIQKTAGKVRLQWGEDFYNSNLSETKGDDNK